MRYEEARMTMLALSGGEHFSMEETVPQRPLKYCRPSYTVTVVGPVIYRGAGTSWKRAVNSLKENMEQEVAA